MRKLKKFLACLLVMILLLSAAPMVYAESEIIEGTCADNLSWSLDEDGILVISGEGEMKLSENAIAPWLEYTEKIKKVEIGDKVTTIGYGAFAYCKQLKEIVIPGNIDTIDFRAFAYSGLEKMWVENGVRKIGLTAFYECENLSEIHLPDSICMIGGPVLMYAGITSLGEDELKDGTFSYTAYFKDEANWENGLLYIDNCLVAAKEDLAGDVEVKPGTVIIADGVFYGRKGITKVVLPDGLKYIGVDSLKDVQSISEIPTSVLGIASIVLNDDSTTKINQYTEADIDNMSEDTLKELMEEITKNGFYDASIDDILLYTELLAYYSYPEIHKVTEGIKLLHEGSFYLSELYFGKHIILPKSLRGISGTVVHQNAVFVLVNSITFLNSDCQIYDSYNTIPDTAVICGYEGSTAQAYAEKYNRDFICIDNCQHEKTCYGAKWESTCNNEGYTGDIYCAYCGELLERGEDIEKKPHSFETKIVEPLCTEDGMKTMRCTDCGYEENETIPATGHSYNEHNVIIRITATCYREGIEWVRCDNCVASKEFIVSEKTDHKDDDNDGYCDWCNEDLNPPAHCDHICHKQGFNNFIYKIIRVFWKLFKINQTCACGQKHY